MRFPEKATLKSKPKRAKIISDQDFKTPGDIIVDQNDAITGSFLTLCRHLGCRPAEAQQVSKLNGKIYAPSAKQRSDGRRLGRFLTVDDAIVLAETRKALGILVRVEPLKRKTLHPVAQSRLNRTST